MLTSLIILFQRFSTPPTIFVTASHQFPKRPQDAMAVWVEELRVDNFKICFREAKIFDGPHKGIKIVSKIDFRVLSFVIPTNKALPKNCMLSKLNKNHNELQIRPQLYGLPRKPSPRAILGELTFHCVVENVKQLFI